MGDFLAGWGGWLMLAGGGIWWEIWGGFGWLPHFFGRGMPIEKMGIVVGFIPLATEWLFKLAVY